MTNHESLSAARWRKSSFSGGANGGGSKCVEVAELADGQIAVRNSNDHAAGALLFTRAEMSAWIAGVHNHEFDDLT